MIICINGQILKRALRLSRNCLKQEDISAKIGQRQKKKGNKKEKLKSVCDSFMQLKLCKNLLIF